MVICVAVEQVCAQKGLPLNWLDVGCYDVLYGIFWAKFHHLQPSQLHKLSVPISIFKTIILQFETYLINEEAQIWRLASFGERAAIIRRPDRRTRNSRQSSLREFGRSCSCLSQRLQTGAESAVDTLLALVQGVGSSSWIARSFSRAPAKIFSVFRQNWPIMTFTFTSNT